MNMNDQFKDGSERPATEQDKEQPKRLSSVMAVVQTAQWLHKRDQERQRILDRTPPASFVPPAPKK